ncbi:Cupin domain protein [Pedococcus cremeus]|uniref:Cupin domain protein n=1 Tax=Pedococcus cremeus TaxID=587636 RepID=A0A1H9XBH1_9MICO|nr:cupin domain-containing protein [Pedococcus cremeus]SES43381.1 Cupin domain protein [Pedococcus cremeus]
MRRLQHAAGAEPAPPEVVSGSAWIRSLAHPEAPSRLVVDDVTFAPGSHTIWHRHPCGQVLVVTAGAGWLQARGRPALAVREGDVVWVEPDEEHWHGAAPDQLLRHLSIQEHDDGRAADLGEPLAAGTYPPRPRDPEEDPR